MVDADGIWVFVLGVVVLYFEMDVGIVCLVPMVMVVHIRCVLLPFDHCGC